MSWDEGGILENESYQPFSFFKSDGSNGPITESIAPGRRWRLTELRAHFSVAFVSVEYLQARISSINGSAYNLILLSYLVSGSTDVILYYSAPRVFESGDQLVISLSNASGVNVIGISAHGWAVAGT